MGKIDLDSMSQEQRERLEYLRLHVERREKERSEWLSRLFLADTTLVSIALPLSLARDMPGIGGALTKAALSCGVLAVATCGVRLRAPLRQAAENAHQVLDDIQSQRDQSVPVSPLTGFEKLCERAALALSALALALLLLAVWFS